MSETMNCATARVLLSKELDAALSTDDARALQAHAASCAACARERAALRKLHDLVAGSLADHPFDASFAREVARVAQRAPRVTELPRRGLRSVVLAVAAAAAAVVVWAVWNGDATQPSSPATEPRVAVARVEGTGALLMDPRAGDRALAPGEEVFLRDRVLASGRAPVTLVLEDGTRVSLRPDTMVEIRRDKDEGQTISLPSSGEVYCEVQKRHAPFRVSGGPITATVMGTRFSVRVESQSAQVVVAEGLVRVTRGTESCLVAADQLAHWDPASPLRPRPAAVAQEIAWHPRFAAARAPEPAAPIAPAPPAPERTASPADVDRTLDQPVQGGRRKP